MTKIIKKFSIDGKEIIARLPRKGDEKKLLAYINGLIEERTYLLESKKKTLKDEKDYMKKILEDMKKGDKLYIVLECGGRIISMFGTENGSHEKNRHICSIALAIIKEFRGKGLGNKIMEMLIDASKNKMKCRVMRLSVYEPNKPAINLYKKYGFREAGRIPKGINHFGKYIDEIIMIKEI